MKRALATAWFLFKHRRCYLEGYVTPIIKGNPWRMEQKIGLKCPNHVKEKSGSVSSWGLIILLGSSYRPGRR